VEVHCGSSDLTALNLSRPQIHTRKLRARGHPVRPLGGVGQRCVRSCSHALGESAGVHEPSRGEGARLQTVSDRMVALPPSSKAYRCLAVPTWLWVSPWHQSSVYRAILDASCMSDRWIQLTAASKHGNVLQRCAVERDK
jgi:hypothetical protein